ncbi:MAG: SAM-dependent DNA methyltransferase [Planctomycetes bacterium]|nr:SAM-dependent DNA methyltransferase [Planctomycetota bacterium]
MSRVTRLPEGPTRVPELRDGHWKEALPRYLKEVEEQNKESARSHRFAAFLQEILGIAEPEFIEAYTSGIEKTVKAQQKDIILRGEVDCLFGNVIIEFEASIPEKRTEAKDQLRRYVAILWSQERPGLRARYLCIATDGVRFVCYTPTLTDEDVQDVPPELVVLNVHEEADWSEMRPADVFFWLDRYFLRNEPLQPTTDLIVRDFGPRSHAFLTVGHTLLDAWREVKEQPSFSVMYDTWDKYLRIVYGEQVAADALFVRHTYLATLAKLMCWWRVTGAASLPTDDQVLDLLEGRLFKAQGIENFIEEDFFSWLAREPVSRAGLDAVRWLFSLLKGYNLRSLSEDVLKALYQELVDPDTRHDLGEFYTPDWLAHRMVRAMLDGNPEASVLDPACGSGTFLYFTIREKLERLGRSQKTLKHIRDCVCGADVHPLAVTIAKTNYILALGDLLKKRAGRFSVPIYLTDTIKIPGMYAMGGSYEILIEGETVYVPDALLGNLDTYDEAIEVARDFAHANRGRERKVDLSAFLAFLTAQAYPYAGNEALARALFTIAATLKKVLDRGRDSIWSFVLKNAYKPLFFLGRFDILIGNPPWIAYHYLDRDYQQFVKPQVTDRYRLLSGRGELIANLEVASLFLLRTADLYLKSGGTIAFVLPKSLFSADHHDALRQRTFCFVENRDDTLVVKGLWDCEQVTPLFNISSCVLFAERAGREAPQCDIEGEILSGELELRNAPLARASRVLTTTKTRFYLNRIGKRSFWSAERGATASPASPYKDRFARGADIAPRAFWFVRIMASPFGFDPNTPPLETDPFGTESAKAPYKNLRLDGIVEAQFLYATLLSRDVIPFGHLPYRLLVLPIVPLADSYQVLEPDIARTQGFVHLSKWIERCEQAWRHCRGRKASAITALASLDYRRKLSAQKPHTGCMVLYNKSGTYLTCCVVEKEELSFHAQGQQLHARGFLAESVTYFCESAFRAEADYLCAVLNAPIVDELIKPMQSRGLWGPRDIHKKVLELPIPEFDAHNARHAALARLGRHCAERVAEALEGNQVPQGAPIGQLRAMVRAMLRAELDEINGIVSSILRP